jgi:hypothetical protein
VYGQRVGQLQRAAASRRELLGEVCEPQAVATGEAGVQESLEFLERHHADLAVGEVFLDRPFPPSIGLPVAGEDDFV